MRLRRLPLILPGLFAAVLVLSGCVAPQSAPPGAVQAAAADEFNDPWEETNRALFGFNQVVDRNLLVPVAKTYRTVVPPPMQQSLHDFLQNLDGPVVFANDVMQGEFGLAANTAGRVVINTTLGFGGIFDVAKTLGVPPHSNDMGITFATWGAGEGPYLMIPVLGPMNPRDLAGKIGDSFLDPGDYVAAQHHVFWASIARAAASGIDTRARNIEGLADIEKTALDYYATIRSLYRQRRAAQIRHEKSDLPNPTPSLGDAGPGLYPPISYSIAQSPRSHEVSVK